MEILPFEINLISEMKSITNNYLHLIINNKFVTTNQNYKNELKNNYVIKIYEYINQL